MRATSSTGCSAPGAWASRSSRTRTTTFRRAPGGPRGNALRGEGAVARGGDPRSRGRLALVQEGGRRARATRRREPPSPFVVRSWGETPVLHEGVPSVLPWCAIELVDGRRSDHAQGVSRAAQGAARADPRRSAHRGAFVPRSPRHPLGGPHPPRSRSPRTCSCAESRHSELPGHRLRRRAGRRPRRHVRRDRRPHGYCALEQLEGNAADAVGP